MKHDAKKRWNGWIIVILNIICVVLLIGIFHIYHDKYNQNIRKQNLTNISNLNESSGELSTKFFENQQQALLNIAHYVSRHHFSMSQLLDFLYDFNAEHENIYEIIGEDRTGYYAEKKGDGEYYNVSYQSKDYTSLHIVFNQASLKNVGIVKFAPEFTDDYGALKCFALYTVLPVYQQDGSLRYYTLMSLFKSKTFIDMIQIKGSYDEMSSLLFNSSGDYIIGNPDFKSDNFFDYITIYNDLSLDEKNALMQEVIASERGTLFYKNSHQEDCSYVYQRIKNEDCYVVSCVPLNSFQELSDDYRFTIFVVVIVMIIFFIDLFWLTSLNRDLKVSMEKERRANSAKTDFLSRMSHDIRTPLNAVIGFSDLAKKEPNLPDTVADELEKVNSSGKYLLSLVNDILDMSKIESNKFTIHESLVNGPAFLNDITSIFRAQAEQKGITFITDFSQAQTPWVYMDELRSRQVYCNLLNNAIKFSERGTTITWKIEDHIISKDSMEMVSVISDQGCGMSEEFMKTLFQPFEQEHNNQSDIEGGTGLGLSIVKNLVELMGGTIQVESELGKGSTFAIHMKRHLGEPPKIAQESKSGTYDLSCLQGKRILLCEDHPLNQEIAVKLLNKKGMLVDTADNGQIGVSKFIIAQCNYYDAILMDIRMPVMNGLDATKLIRNSEKSDAKTIPIIAMTANAFEDDIQNCKDAGMNDHIGKPVSPDNLYFKLCQQLNIVNTKQ